MGRSEEITGLKYDKSLYTDCGFYAGDMDDSYIEEEEKLVKCRKPHKCSACQRDINKGEYAVRETAIFPGEGRRSCYTCTTCIEAWLEESGQAGEGESDDIETDEAE